ncbi:succinate dehydrogenase, cytochrome b558 subunit [Candidatus Sulfotelmatobacter kueseliae]|uniref:Succinate dehydrogenase, cytochrome b558 subunit n=1 Tax=Candidatus Sulfotelmatobacter kueseliae TaxID=2042962 RepID=A0A2U3JXM4_9BACT|nr:succinate dehydrogenase, cytochrome b558 subunit [Candidatus Sulfotelmatobacter kueseliae]
MASAASPPAQQLRQGVAPLRAGEGYSFLLRRLHSLTGIVPIGLFLLEHFISNAEAFKGAAAYGAQVKFLNSLPFVVGLELFGIWIPILYHGLYGIWIWYRGDTNVASYPWTGNWMYTAQRWTGIIALAYMAQHTYDLRFTGVHLPSHPMLAFAKVQNEFQNLWMVAFYAVGIIAASWHFCYGLWLFAAKWGITTGARARRWFGYVCLLLALGLISIGAASMYGFLSHPVEPLNPSAPETIVMTK